MKFPSHMLSFCLATIGGLVVSQQANAAQFRFDATLDSLTLVGAKVPCDEAPDYAGGCDVFLYDVEGDFSEDLYPSDLGLTAIGQTVAGYVKVPDNSPLNEFLDYDSVECILNGVSCYFANRPSVSELSKTSISLEAYGYEYGSSFSFDLDGGKFFTLWPGPGEISDSKHDGIYYSMEAMFDFSVSNVQPVPLPATSLLLLSTLIPLGLRRSRRKMSVRG